MDALFFKTKILIGDSESSQLTDYQNQRILIVCDPFLVGHHMVSSLFRKIEKSNQLTIFSDVVTDPPLAVISKGVIVVAEQEPTVIIGIGGGSAIDTAKAMIYFSRERHLIGEVEFIAIPTTSGTGTEVTSVTVVTDTEAQIKHLIADEALLPDIAILDARLTLSVPPHITAFTGLDVITHALEAYVAKNATPYSDSLAEKALEISFKSLPICYIEGANEQARLDLLIASNLAGMAFNSAGLGLVHSIAHQLGGKFKIPHGLANAIVLEEVITFNSKNSLVLNKYANLTKKLGLVNQGENAEFAVTMLKGYIRAIKKMLNTPFTLRECDISEISFHQEIVNLVNHTLKDQCLKTNPVSITDREIEEIFGNIY